MRVYGLFHSLWGEVALGYGALFCGFGRGTAEQKKPEIKGHKRDILCVHLIM
jgi:hypothetical protein